MKKKYLLLIPLFLLLLTGCVKDTRKTIVLEDENLKLKTTFYYEEGENYTDFEEETGGASKEISFENEDLDLEFDMYYNNMRVATYEASKKSRSSQKFYKEYKFGEYDAYQYGNYESGLYLNIVLNKEGEALDVLFVSLERKDSNPEIVVSDVVAGKEVQKFFNSIKFEKLKK